MVGDTLRGVDLEEIEVVIDPDGTTRIEVRGVPGPGCLAATADLEAALGADVVSRETHAEMHEEAGTDAATTADRARRGRGA